jgi:hypothetical protein
MIPSMTGVVGAALASFTILCAPAAAAGKEAGSQKQALRLAKGETALYLRVPKSDAVAYQGIVGGEGASVDSAQMMYPAVDLVSFLAAVVAHGVIVDSIKRGKKSKMQEAADQVLVPYQPVLKEFRPRDLLQRGLVRSRWGSSMSLIDAADTRLAGWYVESAPMYSMTQDQKALVLDHMIFISAVDAPTGPAYRNVVRVVSHPRRETDMVGYWSENQGERIKEESALLYAESLDMVLADVTADDAENKNPFKTLRYMQGGNEKMERAQLVSATCERKIIRNLRGWLVSIPVSTGTPDSANCAVAQPVSQ